jgi:hypothetical protein
MRPLTGKPDAGKPPVRFGGRGKVNPLFLPLSVWPLRRIALHRHTVEKSEKVESKDEF